jgi:hypothetical protein
VLRKKPSHYKSRFQFVHAHHNRRSRCYIPASGIDDFEASSDNSDMQGLRLGAKLKNWGPNMFACLFDMGQLPCLTSITLDLIFFLLSINSLLLSANRILSPAKSCNSLT